MRSVIKRPTARCSACQLPLRWCLCFACQAIHTPLQVDLLSHPRERTRPTSSGNLIHRLFAGSRQHLWTAPNYPLQESICDSNRELWILHPNGSALPANADPAKIQLLIPDGSWSETAVMSRAISSWGRRVSLPLTGASRYWLRAKQDGERFSTAEALQFLLLHLGLAEASNSLQAQFELHVYASLRARGKIQMAQDYLDTSVLESTMSEILAQLHTRRSRDTEQAHWSFKG